MSDDQVCAKFHTYELSRASGSALPNFITWLGHLMLLAALLLVLTAAAPWQYGLALASALSAPFFYGFSDIVRSLRSLVRKALT